MIFESKVRRHGEDRLIVEVPKSARINFEEGEEVYIMQKDHEKEQRTGKGIVGR